MAFKYKSSKSELKSKSALEYYYCYCQSSKLTVGYLACHVTATSQLPCEVNKFLLELHT